MADTDNNPFMSGLIPGTGAAPTKYSQELNQKIIENLLGRKMEAPFSGPYGWVNSVGNAALLAAGLARANQAKYAQNIMQGNAERTDQAGLAGTGAPSLMGEHGLGGGGGGGGPFGFLNNVGNNVSNGIDKAYEGVKNAFVGGGGGPGGPGGTSGPYVGSITPSAPLKPSAKAKPAPNATDPLAGEKTADASPGPTGAVPPSDPKTTGPYMDVSETSPYGYKWGRMNGVTKDNPYGVGGVKGLTIHYTGDHHSQEQGIADVAEKGFGPQYRMDRYGQIIRLAPPGALMQHQRNGRNGSSNRTHEGIEVTANGNNDVNDDQRDALYNFSKWHSNYYKYDPMKGWQSHGGAGVSNRDAGPNGEMTPIVQGMHKTWQQEQQGPQLTGPPQLQREGITTGANSDGRMNLGGEPTSPAIDKAVKDTEEGHPAPLGAKEEAYEAIPDRGTKTAQLGVQQTQPQEGGATSFPMPNLETPAEITRRATTMRANGASEKDIQELYADWRKRATGERYESPAGTFVARPGQQGQPGTSYLQPQFAKGYPLTLDSIGTHWIPDIDKDGKPTGGGTLTMPDGRSTTFEGKDGFSKAINMINRIGASKKITEAQSGAVGKEITKAIEEGGQNASEQERYLNVMDILNNDNKMPRGPTKDWMLKARELMGNVGLGSLVQNSTQKAEVFQKLAYYLAAKHAETLSSRVSNFNMMTAMANNPSLFMTQPGVKSLIDLMRQDLKAKRDVGQIASKVQASGDWQDYNKQIQDYYDKHTPTIQFRGQTPIRVIRTEGKTEEEILSQLGEHEKAGRIKKGERFLLQDGRVGTYK